MARTTSAGYNLELDDFWSGIDECKVFETAVWVIGGCSATQTAKLIAAKGAAPPVAPPSREAELMKAKQFFTDHKTDLPKSIGAYIGRELSKS